MDEADRSMGPKGSWIHDIEPFYTTGRVALLIQQLTPSLAHENLLPSLSTSATTYLGEHASVTWVPLPHCTSPQCGDHLTGPADLRNHSCGCERSSTTRKRYFKGSFIRDRPEWTL